MKRLVRIKEGRMLGGVCGGIAKYLDIDPVIIRILWVVFTLFFGVGLLVYVVAWILIPEEGEEESVEIDTS
ncbi:MAG: PspC domain-containing protein [Halobacteriota archaeon]